MNVASPGRAGDGRKGLAFHLGEHDHEQERDDDRPRIDDHGSRGEELGPGEQEEARGRQHHDANQRAL